MNGVMKAGVFEGNGNLVIKPVPIPRIEKPDQILLKVEAVSICGTDVHIVEVPPAFYAPPGTILGHEFVGTVVEKGSEVTHLEIGDHVVVNPNDYCGVCSFCRQHLPNQCENLVGLGISVNGAFAEFCRVSGKVAYRISKEVPVQIAAFAEPMACAINGTNKVRLQPGETVAIIGCGPIGLLIAQLFKSAGAAKIFLSDQSDFRLDVAKKLDLGRVVDIRKEDFVDVIMQETNGGTDVAADMVGSQMVTAMNAVRKDGKVILFGINLNAEVTFKQFLITSKEIHVMGSWLANATFPDAVRILESGILQIEPLITEEISLDDLPKGVAKLGRGEAVKIIVKP